ncbi:MBG domain-containing protein [Salegentibacter sp. F14]
MDTNYSITLVAGELEIIPATLAITVITNQSKIYGEADSNLTYTATGFKNGDDESILTGKLTRTAGENVGTYQIIQGTLDADDNYNINFTGADFTITERTLSVFADANQGKVFGEADPTLTYTASNFGNGDNESVLTGLLSRQSGETVGAYAITQGNLDAGNNYTIDYTGSDFTITEKTLIITVDAGQSKIYGEADPVFTYTANGFENGDNESILDGELERVVGQNVGHYDINQGSLTANGNYMIDYVGAEFAITKKTLGITAEFNQNKVYGESDPILTYIATGFENGDDESILTGELVRTVGETVGTYSINQGSLSTNNNYTIAYSGADFVITKRTLIVQADPNQGKVYGEADPILTYSAINFGNGDNESIFTGALNRQAGEAVGRYAITQGNLSAGENYMIDYTGADFTISEKTLNITVDTNQSKVYGEADPSLSYTVTGFENGDDESILTGELERESGENIGTYPINLGSLAASGDYTFNFTGTDFEITAGVLTVTASNGQNKVYGESDPILVFTATGFKNGDDESILTGVLKRQAGEAVGSYVIIQGDLSAGSNYTIDYTGSDFVITEKSLTITVTEGQNKIYGETDPGLTYTATGFQFSEDESILTGALEREAGENAGNYAITQGSLVATANYSIDFTGADFEITPRTLVVIADSNQSKVYGERDPLLTYSASNYGNGDNESIFTGALDRQAGEAVGSYAITQGGLSAGENYTIDYTGADFTISEKMLNITVDTNQSKVYGEADPSLSYTVTGFENGDDESIITGQLERAPGEKVGTYAIDQGSLEASGDYTINFTGSDFVITEKSVTITVTEGQNKIYGEADPGFTYTATGFQFSEDESILTGALEREAGENAGNYAITQGSLVATANYSIDFTGADFEITPRTLVVIADSNQSKVYGERDPLLTYSASNYGNGDNESIFTGALDRQAGEAVGSYAITQGGLSAGENYTIDYTGADFTISEKMLNITVDTNQSKVYGEADPSLSYTVTGFENGDDESILTGQLERAPGEKVGTYAIDQGSLAASGDYTINFTGGDFKITPATLNITVDSGQSKIYGEADPRLSYTATGFVNGNDESILSGALEREEGENVGEYEIRMGDLKANFNYEIEFISETFSITPASLDLSGLDDIVAECGIISLDTPVATDSNGNEVAGVTNFKLPVSAPGTYTIQWEFSGANYLSLQVTQSLVIADTTAPLPVQDELEVIEVNTQLSREEVETPTATDNCSGEIVAITNATFPIIENTTITWLFKDASGNIKEQQQVVVINDITPPVPDKDELDDILAECRVSEVIAPTAKDNTGKTLTGFTDTDFPITAQGKTIITWIFEDENGNRSTQTQVVMIQDQTAPVPDQADLQDIIVACGIENIAPPTASDNCEGEIIATTGDPTSYTEQGDYIITWTFTDAAGNSSTQDQFVVVEDLTAPVALASDLDIEIDFNDSITIRPEDIDAGSYDECGEVTLSLDRDYFDEEGTYEVTLSVTDPHGNSSQTTARVTVNFKEFQTTKVHVVPTMLEAGEVAKVIVAGGSLIKNVEVLEVETGKYKVFRGNNLQQMNLDIAPMKGTLLIRVSDDQGKVHLKKLIAL